MRGDMLGHGLLENIFVNDIAHTAVTQTCAVLIDKNKLVINFAAHPDILLKRLKPGPR